MLEPVYVMNGLYNGIADVAKQCGFTAAPAGGSRGGSPVYERSGAAVVDLSGEKGRLRFVFSGQRIHFLSGPADVDLSDDSAFNLDSTFFFDPETYTDRDIKTLVNEISEYLTDSYAEKKPIVSKKKVQTVSTNAARSGSQAYDPVTLASKLSSMYPEFRDMIRENVDLYGEFLCETFFTGPAEERILGTIRENHPQRMKKLFGILGDVYEDGTNEVQSLIAVTVLGPIRDDPELIQRILPYLTDTMLEPVLAVGKRLKKSKSANLRLAHPPAYKPKKQKKPGLMQRMMNMGGEGGPLGQQ